MNRFVTVQYAAKYLGVSPSTFKRFCETNNIPVERTPGGHRRIDRSDLDLAFGLLWGNTNSRTCDDINSVFGDASEICQQLIQGQVQEVTTNICKHLVALDQLVYLLEATIIKAMWKIGEMWQSRSIDIYQEHRATKTAFSVLESLSNRMPPIENPYAIAVGGTFEGIHDTLATKMVSMVLRSIRIDAIDLGCHLPAASIANAANAYNASIIWICHTHISDLETLIASHQLLRNSIPESTRVMFGGGGVSPAIRRSIPNCYYFESMSLMVESLQKEIAEERRSASKDCNRALPNEAGLQR